MLTVAIIPARGGSRRLPGKNLRTLGGEPMLARTVGAALESRRVARVLVSTDDEAIARAAERAGAEVPFIRPAELARDDTPTVPVIQHAIAHLEAQGSEVGVVVTLQPTSPLRDAREIDAVVSLLDDPGLRSAVSVTPLDLPITVVGWLQDGRFIAAGPAGSGSPAARVTGGVYATRRDLLAEGRLLDDRPAAHVVHGPAAIDVDTAADLAAARRELRRRQRASAP